MPDCSPVKWHLAHTTWFFETFILARFLPGHPPFHPPYRMLFNSYYNAIRDRHPPPQRGMLSRRPLADTSEERLVGKECSTGSIAVVEGTLKKKKFKYKYS